MSGAVVVSGGAGGIGAETCRLLAERGFPVVVADRADPSTVAAEVGGLAVQHDVTDPASWEHLLAVAVDRFGPLHGLVAGAGVKSEYLLTGPPDPENFARTAAVNQLGVLLGLQIVGGHLREQGAGSIVVISSGAGMPPAQSPDLAYVGTKWAVRGIARAASRELAPHGVRVNTVLPGLVRTPMTAAIDPARIAAIESGVPLRRMGEPVGIARAVYVFLSELGGWCSGSELVVAGGSLA